MSGVFAIMIGVALALVVVALVLGLFSMARGGEFAAKYSNKLMRLRVAMQFVAVVLILAAFIFAQGP